MTGKNKNISEFLSHELLITRIFNTSPEIMFTAWTDPGQLTQWWGPEGCKVLLCQLELCPGGSICLHMRSPEGKTCRIEGVYYEIDEPERLIFTSTAFRDDNGDPRLKILNTAIFTDAEDMARLTFQAVVLKASPEVTASVEAMEESWNQSLDKLERLLADM